jgi:hypothetical protein
MNTDQATEIINARIRDRNNENTPQALLSFYPKSTRFPVNDAPLEVETKNWQKYSVDRESELRQTYIPSSTSDLYNYSSQSNNNYMKIENSYKDKNELIFNNFSRLK